MQRLTSRILLVLLLVSTFAPAALAVDGPPQHACCLRMLHSHSQTTTTLAAVHPRDGNCCPPMATGHWAQVAQQAGVGAALAREIAGHGLRNVHPGSSISTAYSGRAPPTFSIA
jgi:hypothetical protein